MPGVDPRRAESITTAVGDTVLLVPVKRFGEAKARLAPVLDGPGRAHLARWMANRVLDAAGEMPAFVACDDEAVAEWAEGRGATVLWRPGVGLNAAVNTGVAELARHGATHVVVAHGDLPVAPGFAHLVHHGVLTLVPDRHDDGTNVAVVPVASAFEMSYGPGSFRRHLANALAAGLTVEVRRDPLLAVDVDTPDDFGHPIVQEVLRAWQPTIQASPHSYRSR